MAKSSVLTLKYRPKNFYDLVGNSVLVEILRNSVKNRRIKSAYFFSGGKGSGKTTTVRIFAKAINCIDPQDGEPCNKCPSCLAIERGQSQDVAEIDAASRNRVSDIREMTQGLQYMPSEGAYRVQILDEVHMLSTAASNALLKTLEEPPNHVVFMFCTTDPQKVVDTIRSRCMNFSFQRLSRDEISNRLLFIAKKEGLILHPLAARLIAQTVNGAMRDAITYLDQASLLSDTISEQMITDLVGFITFEEIAGLFIAVSKKDAKAVTEWVSAMESGSKLELDIISSLLRFIENVLLVQQGVSVKADFSTSVAALLREIATALSYDQLIRMIAVVRDTMYAMRQLAMPDNFILIHFMVGAFLAIAEGKLQDAGKVGPTLLELAGLKEDELSIRSLFRRYFRGDYVIPQEPT